MALSLESSHPTRHGLLQNSPAKSRQPPLNHPSPSACISHLVVELALPNTPFRYEMELISSLTFRCGDRMTLHRQEHALRCRRKTRLHVLQMGASHLYYPPCRSSNGGKLQSSLGEACRGSCRSLCKWRRRWCDVQMAMTSLLHVTTSFRALTGPSGTLHDARCREQRGCQRA